MDTRSPKIPLPSREREGPACASMWEGEGVSLHHLTRRQSDRPSGQAGGKAEGGTDTRNPKIPLPSREKEGPAYASMWEGQGGVSLHHRPHRQSHRPSGQAGGKAEGDGYLKTSRCPSGLTGGPMGSADMLRHSAGQRPRPQPCTAWPQ
jgi:hypothetical protein